MPKYTLTISENEVLYIDAHTGEKNRNEYLCINFHIKDDPDDNRYYLCYNECKTEIEHINKIIKSMEETSSFIAGL